MNIRAAEDRDGAAIRRVLTAAFGGDAEAHLVERLRASRHVEIELIAEEGGEIIGHILFSRLEAPRSALALAPVAVAPGRQRQGIGGALIQAGHAIARERGWEAVFVLGDPSYYGRFGYSAEAAAAFDSTYSGPHFMLLALAERTSVTPGPVRYAPAFAELG